MPSKSTLNWRKVLSILRKREASIFCPLPVVLAHAQPGDDVEGRVHGGVEAGQRQHDVEGMRGQSLLGVNRGRRADDLLVALPARVGPLGAESRDRAVNRAGIELLDLVVSDAQLVGYARLEILDDDVGLFGQVEGDLQPPGLLEVERDALLAAVPDHEGVLASHGVAVGALHLDDVGALLCQQHGREGAGDILAEVEHPDTVQYSFTHMVPP